ncbi:DUF2141 domain-containing protein [Pseudoxanthomonas sp. CF125]|uniref:DUF2141 domain-containing protein n=1 Tax=Pseudoxanthomonas sp. CF125 TaxID=1855303 RepID=UPI00088D677C|nr:DUF2141 domain-containing protein [Pseudoxanthomonas sp. CF125]SDR14113.1 Uncharacterized conserved protein, DUF2141 family [Pseudoxanthomonas sp. CF125]
MNRTAAFRIAPLALIAALSSASALAGDLTVKLHGIRAQTGLVKVAVVDSQEAWDGKAAPVQADGVPAQGEEASFTFKDLKPGNYAVMITHDENGNGKMDTNVMGMPLEGYGFSNNPQVMRKPTWDEARFQVTATGAAIDVDLR